MAGITVGWTSVQHCRAEVRPTRLILNSDLHYHQRFHLQ